MRPPLLESHIAGRSCRRGKVRDVYDIGDRLVIVATDRISAFDWVLPTGIPDKGRILTAMTLFWFDFLRVPNHLLGTDVRAMGPEFAAHADVFQGRTMLVRKAQVVPFECVVRGYLAGSGWKEYRQASQQKPIDLTKAGRVVGVLVPAAEVCGVQLPAGLRECDRLPEPIFTPATKAESGHDENVSFATMAAAVGQELADDLRRRSLDIYVRAAKYAESCGILLADTKFEWGTVPDGSRILIDEVLTPDSSRFWPADSYRPGTNPPSFDKQFVRDWLERSGWDKNSPPPPLPDDVVRKTREKYLEAATRLRVRADVEP